MNTEKKDYVLKEDTCIVEENGRLKIQQLFLLTFLSACVCVCVGVCVGVCVCVLEWVVVVVVVWGGGTGWSEEGINLPRKSWLKFFMH